MELKVGDKAPQFEGVIQDGSAIRLSDYLGKKVLLYFYPKDNTPGCTAQSCNLRDNFSRIKQEGYVVLGISSDSLKSHSNFKTKYELPFDLIADKDKSIHDLYGTWGEKMMFGRKFMGTKRTTYVIDENGVISRIFKKVNTQEHTEQVLG